MDDGVLGVGGEPRGGEILPQLHVAFHALAAPLLVGAEDDPHPALKLQPGVEEGLGRKEGRHDGALVVQDSPPPDHAVFELAAPGIHRPALALGNHVQVTEDSHHFVSFSHLGPACHVLHVLRPEPHFLREGEGPVEAFPRALPVGSSFRRLAADAGDAYNILNGGHKFIFHRIKRFLKQ